MLTIHIVKHMQQLIEKTNSKTCHVTAMCDIKWWSEFLATQRRCIVFAVRYELNLYMLCRRK
jgi:hypothetical protein